jgi:hypothetical protein
VLRGGSGRVQIEQPRELSLPPESRFVLFASNESLGCVQWAHLVLRGGSGRVQIVARVVSRRSVRQDGHTLVPGP